MTNIIALGLAATVAITEIINRTAGAIQKRITIVRWRRRTLRELNQRRRG